MAAPHTTSEITFFDAGHILVTSKRLTVFNETYAMSGITSVRTEQQVKDTGGASVILFILGVFCVFIALMTEPVFFGSIGGLCVLVGFITMMRAKAVINYKIILRTSGGEISAVETTDADLSLKIYAAINNAMTS